jgi:putative transposase
MGVVINGFGENLHHRKSIRFSGYDYSEPGGYFITISTFQHIELFGKIIGQAMQLNPFGIIVQEEWLHTPEIRLGITLDEFVFMPDHMHAIVLINDPDVGAHSCAPLQEQ